VGIGPTRSLRHVANTVIYGHFAVASALLRVVVCRKCVFPAVTFCWVSVRLLTRRLLSTDTEHMAVGGVEFSARGVGLFSRVEEMDVDIPGRLGACVPELL
jgi:hypothetical protein